MRRSTGWVLAACAAAGVAFAGGCRTSKKEVLTHPHVEEFGVAPDEPRYNNPPESGYKKPPPKQDFKPGPGATPGASMGGPGF